MGLTLRSLLLFLRNLLSFLRKKWDQSAHRLWYIFSLPHSRLPSALLKKRDDTRRNIEPRPKPPGPTVICASRLPPPLTLSPIVGGDTPIASPTPISIEIRQPTILTPSYDSDNDEGNNRLGIDGSFLRGSSPISRSPEYHNEPGPIHTSLPQSREDITSNSPIETSRPDSIHSSHRSASQYAGHRSGNHPWSQYSHKPSSYRSPPSVYGAEAAARGFAPASTRPSSPVSSVRPQSFTGSVGSHVYGALKPKTRVKRPTPMANAPRPKSRPPTPASVRPSVHMAPPDPPDVSVPPDVPELPRPESRTTESVQGDRISVTVSSDQLPASQLKGVLRPMFGIDRYEKHKEVIIEETDREYITAPVTVYFTRESSPKDWTPMMHPEGALYWVHEKEPIYTDTNMCDPHLRQRIEEALEEIDRLRVHSALPTDGWELALELGVDPDTEEAICSYYFAFHPTRCLFWLHDFDLRGALDDLRGVTEQTHIHLALQAQYWTHWEMYPCDRDVPEHLIQELLGILVHAGVDCMTSPNSTAAYSEGELNKLMDYVKNVTKVGGDHGFAACIIGRLMSFFLHSRYVNFFGQKGARLANDQTIFGEEWKRTYLIKSMSIIFFYAPELHLKGLESVYTDFVLCQHRWARFIKRLQEDWTEFILYGTVLLNANVQFLAVPGVDPGNHYRSPTQIANYLSIITSIGSIVIGLLLLRQHKTKPEDSADEVYNYLQSRRNNALGFETLAILYSLPYALLLWSTVGFTTAFCLEALVSSHQLWVKLSLGIAFAMTTSLISWCIWTTIEAGIDFSLFGAVHDLKDRLVGFTKGLREKTPEPGPDVGNSQAGGGRKNRWKLRQSRALRETFKFLRHGRGGSMSSTLVSRRQSGIGLPRPSEGTVVEMDEVKDKEPV